MSHYVLITCLRHVITPPSNADFRLSLVPFSCFSRTCFQNVVPCIKSRCVIKAKLSCCRANLFKLCWKDCTRTEALVHFPRTIGMNRHEGKACFTTRCTYMEPFLNGLWSHNYNFVKIAIAFILILKMQTDDSFLASTKGYGLLWLFCVRATRLLCHFEYAVMKSLQMCAWFWGW